MVVSWAVAVSTRNRPAPLGRLLGSLAEQTVPPAAVAVVDQSDQYDEDLLRGLAGPLPYELRCAAGSGGASAGRNQAVSLLPRSVHWIATPNDTSTVRSDFGAVLLQAADEFPGAGCLVGTYWDGDQPSRRPGTHGEQLRGWQLWMPKEPSCVWRATALRATGGFDPRLGPGSAGLAQAGEGTDLLCRVAAGGDTVVWAPALAVDGLPHHLHPDLTARAAKDYTYNVGTGVVYRRHFAGPASWVRLPFPIADGLFGAVAGRSLEPLRLGIATARGRIRGYLMPERSVRPRGGPNRSDAWRPATDAPQGLPVPGVGSE